MESDGQRVGDSDEAQVKSVSRFQPMSVQHLILLMFYPTTRGNHKIGTTYYRLNVKSSESIADELNSAHLLYLLVIIVL